MRFSTAGNKRREELHIDLTPMIDVVFQLVLFLLLTTTFKKEEEEQPEPVPQAPGIQVDLPRASSTAVIADKKDLNVWMAADGTVYLEDQPVGSDDLKREFKRAARQDKTTLVVIKADKGVAHGRVVRVMDIARNEGLSRLAIATASEEM